MNDVVDLREPRGAPNSPAPRELPDSAPSASPPPKKEGAARSNETSLLSWEAPEFRERLRNRERWIRTTFGIAIPLAALFLMLKNVLGAVVTVLAAFTVLLEAFRKPRRMRFTITPQGVAVNEKLYPYRDLESFWVFTDDPNDRILSVKTKRALRQHLAMPLSLTDPDVVRAALKVFLPEEEQGRSAFDSFTREIGF